MPKTIIFLPKPINCLLQPVLCPTLASTNKLLFPPTNKISGSKLLVEGNNIINIVDGEHHTLIVIVKKYNSPDIAAVHV